MAWKKGGICYMACRGSYHTCHLLWRGYYFIALRLLAYTIQNDIQLSILYPILEDLSTSKKKVSVKKIWPCHWTVPSRFLCVIALLKKMCQRLFLRAEKLQSKPPCQNVDPPCLVKKRGRWVMNVMYEQSYPHFYEQQQQLFISSFNCKPHIVTNSHTG